MRENLNLKKDNKDGLILSLNSKQTKINLGILIFIERFERFKVDEEKRRILDEEERVF